MTRRLLYVVPTFASPLAFVSELGTLPLTTSWAVASGELRDAGWPSSLFADDYEGEIAIIAIELPKHANASLCELQCVWRGEQKTYSGVVLHIVSPNDTRVLHALDVIKSLTAFIT